MISMIGKCMTLELLCLMIAGSNLVIRLLFLVLTLLGDDETLYLLTIADPPEMYGSYFLSLLRPLVVMDCIISLIFTVLLIVGVKKSDRRILWICYLYGMVVVGISMLGTFPGLIKKMLEGDKVYLRRRLLSLFSIGISAVEVFVLYKTYIKFANFGTEHTHLVESSQGTPTIVHYKNCYHDV